MSRHRTATEPKPDTADEGAPHDASAALELPLTSLPGIGPARAEALRSLGVRRVRDLVFLLPRRLQTAGAELPIADASARRGEEVTIRATVDRIALQRFGRRSTLRLTLRDGSGSIAALFFNQPWMRKSFEVGKEVVLRGKVGVARGPALLSPKLGTDEKPLSAAGTIELVYPSADGVSSEAVGRLARSIAARCASTIEEPLPAELLAARDLPALAEAVATIHAPPSAHAFERARRRLALEPLLRMGARLEERRRSRAESGALRVELDLAARAELLARFPFAFTKGQLAVVDELCADLARGAPMRRLLQGDVGSGKTVLGVFACLAVARAGGQSAFLAPTELLAEQHFAGLKELLRACGVHAVFLTGSLAAAERRAVLAQLESGMADVVFGTHALFSADVRYKALALCVIDEQQRFGVAQRTRLVEKGERAHVLLMTATPIPRTLALTLYGDLDTSILRERPAGRGRVRTKWVRGADRRKVPAYLEERLAAGEQVYWVAPRIGASAVDDEDPEAGERASAERAFAKLSETPVAAHKIELRPPPPAPPAGPPGVSQGRRAPARRDAGSVGVQRDRIVSRGRSASRAPSARRTGEGWLVSLVRQDAAAPCSSRTTARIEAEGPAARRR
ncbi:MAG: DEAD/DEAH box helicase [Planctomycetes bacterium]|nr:DEAD/DEAH box helicase [Planctomycetota bacterium]